MSMTRVGAWWMYEGFGSVLYLSDVLIGCQNDLIKSWGWDLYSLLERNGHHGSLRQEQVTEDVLSEMNNIPKVYYQYLDSLVLCFDLVLMLPCVCSPWSVLLGVSGSADRSSSWPVILSFGGSDHCTCRWWGSLNFWWGRSSPTERNMSGQGH